MKELDDDHPHYDDLIKELHELKRFIESNGDNAAKAADAPSGRTPPPQETTEATRDPASPETGGTPDAGTPGDEGPPTLRQAVRRQRPHDEMQLDLLSVSQPTGEPPVEVAFTVENPREPSTPDAPEAEILHDSEQNSESPTASSDRAESTGTVPASTGPKDVDESTTLGDDEIAAFVYDLSDRILDTIEDKLLERSGELLPDDVRDELRESVGELLYQWCER